MGERTITPITYREAADILGVNQGSMQHAIGRGALTQLPREGRKQLLIKEQVELFKGKWISFRSLDADELRAWKEYESQAILQYYENQGPDAVLTAYIAQQQKLLDEKETELTEVEKESMSSLALLGILLGLVLILFVLSTERKEARKQVERTIEKMGLDKSDLVDQQNAIAVLKSHPKELEQIKTILEQENLLAVA